MSKQKNQKSERIFLVTPHSWVEKALGVGWELPEDVVAPDTDVILLEWMRDGKPVMPFKSREKKNVRR